MKGPLDLGTFDHVLDRGLHVDDVRWIQDDLERSSGQVIDGCRDKDLYGITNLFLDRCFCVVHFMRKIYLLPAVGEVCNN